MIYSKNNDIFWSHFVSIQPYTVSQMMPYSPQEERWNTITHGLGALLAVIATGLMLYFSLKNGTSLDLACTTVYGLSLILLYSASTIYHGVRQKEWKDIFRKVDYLCIYLLIAGTYTPIVLLGIGGTWGWILFGIVWLLTILGFIFQFSPLQNSSKISLILYGGMGWLIVIGIKPLLEGLPFGAISLIVAGGLLYTLGIFFYVKERIRFNHVIWHLFVLGGSIMHFLAIFFYVIP